MISLDQLSYSRNTSSSAIVRAIAPFWVASAAPTGLRSMMLNVLSHSINALSRIAMVIVLTISPGLNVSVPDGALAR